MEHDEKKIAAVFKAFCDENRIRILRLLLSGEKCGIAYINPTNLCDLIRFEMIAKDNCSTSVKICKNISTILIQEKPFLYLTE